MMISTLEDTDKECFSVTLQVVEVEAEEDEEDSKARSPQVHLYLI